jgi:Arc/MetJ-type ribon-helix-helix transcriptional regulator
MREAKLTKRITVRLPRDLADFVDAEAKRRGVSKSALIREALYHYIDKEMVSFKCKVHPKYKAVREPTSQKSRCECRAIWDWKQSRLERGLVTDVGLANYNKQIQRAINSGEYPDNNEPYNNDAFTIINDLDDGEYCEDDPNYIWY